MMLQNIVLQIVIRRSMLLRMGLVIFFLIFSLKSPNLVRSCRILAVAGLGSNLGLFTRVWTSKFHR